VYCVQRHRNCRISPDHYHMWMFDSNPGVADCVIRNVTPTCGEEIGIHIAEIGRKIEAEYGVCDIYEKRNRGKPWHCSVVRNLHPITSCSLQFKCTCECIWLYTR